VMPAVMNGSTAIMPKNNAPASVMRLITRPRYDSVGRPGRTPGIKPPLFYNDSGKFCCVNITIV
jgi:hypothetical protein